MSYKLDGTNPLAYMGVQPVTPPLAIVLAQSPTQNNTSFNLLTFWLNSETEDVYVLTNLAAGLATWTQISAGAPSGIQTITTEDSVVVSPTLGNVHIVGGAGITTAGSASTVTINLFTPVTVPFGGTGQSYFPLNSIPIGNDTAPFLSLGPPTADGQTLIGSATGDLVLNTLTAGSGITITNGPGTITIASSGSRGFGSILGSCLVVVNSQAAGTYWGPPFDYSALSVNSTGQASEEFSMPIGGTISNLYATIGKNVYPSNLSITVNKNGTNTPLTVTIPSYTTGVFTDLTDSFTVVAGDTIQFEVYLPTNGSGTSGLDIDGTVSILFTS